MKIAVLLAARTVSKRLPHKVLRLIKGKTVLANTVERLRRARRPDEVIVCTSTAPVDDIVADTAQLLGWPCYRGSEDDVLERFYQAALENHADLLIRATGDNMLVCPEHIDWQIERHLEAAADWSTVDGLPCGMKAEVITIEAMERLYLYAEDTRMTEYMTWYFDQPEYFNTLHIEAPPESRRPDYRLTLDTPADLELLRRVCDRFDKPPAAITTKEIIELLDGSPELVKINAAQPDRSADEALRASVNTRILDEPNPDRVAKAR